MKPKLRPVQIVSMVHQGQPALMLRDPLRLTDRVMVVSQQLGPVLALMDGTRDLDGLRASLMFRKRLRCRTEPIPPAAFSSPVVCGSQLSLRARRTGRYAGCLPRRRL